MSEKDDDLVEAMRALPREMTPPARVGAALAATHRARRLPTAWQAAIAASVLAAVFVAGRVTAPGPAPAAGPSREFVFLLYGGETGGSDPSAGDRRAAEYGAWARLLRERGVPVSGERLADISWIAGEPRPADGFLRGFFIVRAADATAAIELARAHPHARFGSIEVRPVDTP